MMKKKRKDKHFLDTSIQVEKVKNNKFRKLLEKRSVDSIWSTSYFVLFEYRVGLIFYLISYFFLVKACDTVDDALAFWSDKNFGRESSYKGILDAIIARYLGDTTTSNKDLYLIQIETVIFRLSKDFHHEIEIMVGEFSSDEIVNFKINSREDFREFMDLCRRRQVHIPLENFYLKNLENTNSVISYSPIPPIETKDLDRLTEVVEILKYIQSNPTKRIGKNKNLKLGDTTIAIDMPQSHTLNALDSYFSHICLCLKKQHLHIEKFKPPTI